MLHVLMKIGWDFGRDFINPKSKSHPKAQAGKTCKALFIRLSVLCTPIYSRLRETKKTLFFIAISLAAAKEFTLKPTDHANTKNIPGNLFCIFFTSWSLLVFRCRLISIYKLTQWNHLLYQVVSAKHYIYSLIVPYSFCYINTQHVIIRPYDSIPGGVLPCTP